MWRVFSSVQKGARSIRPSQCCSQDNADEKGKWNSNSSSSPLPEAQCQAVVPHHALKNQKNENLKYICPLVAITKKLGTKVGKGDNSNPDSQNQRPKFTWVWAIPCDVYPHSQEKWKNKWEEERWKRFHRRRHHLLPYSILNAVGWGSAAAFTWTLFKYFKSVSLAYKQNQKQIQPFNNTNGNRDNCDPSHSANLESNEKHQNWTNEDYYQYDSYCLQISPAWWLSQNGFHHWKVDSQTGNQETSRQEFVFNNNFTRSIVVSPPFTSDDQALHKQSYNKNEISKEFSTTVEGVFDVYNEEKPQIETDRDTLQRRLITRQDNSGYCEDNKCESNISSRTPPDFSTYHYASEDNLVKPSSFQAQESKTHDVLHDDCPNSTHSTDDFLFNNSSVPADKLPIEPDKTQNKSQQNEVIIEDCSCSEDSVPIVALSSSQSEVLEAQTSLPKQNTNTTVIDEFSDGLKEIIEAGKKDLNDFSTQFLGILEGDIGRSIATEEPQEAIRYFRAGALLGDASSAFNLALCYHMAQGIEQDLKKARELYEAASLVGHGWATYNLAVMLNEGQGGPADPTRAGVLLAKAADMGVTEAQAALAQLEELQDHSIRNQDIDLQADHKPTKRDSISSVQSEPSLRSVLSNMWLSSYSTSDLDFLEDTLDQNVQDLSSLRTDVVEKPRFYLS